MDNFTPPADIDFSNRNPDSEVLDLIHSRFSPRSYRKTQLESSILTTVFDAARWAPSCFNEQPWIFLTSDEQSFSKFLNLLVDANQSWAKNASLIGFVLARKHFLRNGKANRFAQFDCGSAWMAMSLQAYSMGLYTHGMGGIKTEEIYTAFNIDKDKMDVLCGFTLGVLDTPEPTAEELQDREKPSTRQSLSDCWKQGQL